jgi:hypothetical protein
MPPDSSARPDRLRRPPRPHPVRLAFWLMALLLTGCATEVRDDFKLRKDIDNLNLTKTPIAAARVRLSELGFICDKGYEPYANSLLRAVSCKRTVPGFACRDDEQVSLEYQAESGLVERVTTRRANTCL